jgi:hypothetical protein
VTVAVFVLVWQPVFPVTVYVVVDDGFAVTVAPIPDGGVNPVVGVHV